MNELSDLGNASTTPAGGEPTFTVRRYGWVNRIGLLTLVVREARRFLKVAVQTVFAPTVSTLLLLAVFAIALGADREAPFADVTFVAFLAPGLVMMSILNNAFANTSSSLIVTKIQGNSVDFLMPPLSSFELNIGFLSGAVSRGLLVGLVSVLVIWASGLAPVSVTNIGLVMYFALAASIMLGAAGLIGGIWAEKFDHLAAVTNFVITPLSFLSGTFYAIERLPEPLYAVSLANPLFYLIDGFRAGFIGEAEGNVIFGMAYVGLWCVALVGLTQMILRSGYKLRA